MTKIESKEDKSTVVKLHVSDCTCTITMGREGEKGNWCLTCGKKVLEVESRKCEGCKYCKFFTNHHICTKHHMHIHPTMHVTYKVSEGSCFEYSS